jgi:hypothetical protein
MGSLQKADKIQQRRKRRTDSSQFVTRLLVRRPPKADKIQQRRTEAEKISLKADNLQQRQFKARLGGRHINRLLGEGIYS